MGKERQDFSVMNSAEKRACIDDTKHSKSQIPPNSYWTFSCNPGLKTSVAHFRNLLLSLEIKLYSIVGQNNYLCSEISIFVRVHKLLQLPFFVSITLSTIDSSKDIKSFINNSRICNTHENHFKEKVQD